MSVIISALVHIRCFRCFLLEYILLFYFCFLDTMPWSFSNTGTGGAGGRFQAGDAAVGEVRLQRGVARRLSGFDRGLAVAFALGDQAGFFGGECVCINRGDVCVCVVEIKGVCVFSLFWM